MLLAGVDPAGRTEGRLPLQEPRCSRAEPGASEGARYIGAQRGGLRPRMIESGGQAVTATGPGDNDGAPWAPK